MTDKRYQVFISSTFVDLQEERAKVQQAIMELDCIPAGMEIFPAIDEEQFEFIKRVIDDCDYYVLIIGGRYGSVSDAGVSYTEMEYDYAISKGIKVMAFLHKNPESLPLKKSESSAKARKSLAAFRAKAATNRLVKLWETDSELPGLVALSLSKTIKTYPAVGWVRGDSVASADLYKQLSDLQKENQQLKETLHKHVPLPAIIEDIAGLDEVVRINGYGYDEDDDYKQARIDWSAQISWSKIFSIISPFLLVDKPESQISEHLARHIQPLSNKPKPILVDGNLFSNYTETIRVQFRALGLITIRSQLTTAFWSLTEKGDREMLNVKVVRKTKSAE
jgi:hypothetical protein